MMAPELALGSSPLARGLRNLVQHLQVLDRIIPARAGFTDVSKSVSIWESDHPRSRGVYHFRLVAAQVDEGSSPLARGLRRAAINWGSGSRIIPARAGFTARRRCPRRRPRDHPRSRGVYVQVTGAAFDPKGSSPLARGLPGYRIACVRDGRIIPARAGFTTTNISETSISGDHPRSRGVYARARGCA